MALNRWVPEGPKARAVRWLIIGGVLVSAAVIVYMRRRDTASWDELRAQLDETAARAREAVEGLQQNRRLLLEEMRELLREAMEEGREAAGRKMSDLQERFHELRNEPRALSNTERHG